MKVVVKRCKVGRVMMGIFLLMFVCGVAFAASNGAVNGSRVSGILNPLPGERITDTVPTIGVAFPQTHEPIEPDTIIITLDGIDVTREAVVTIEYIFYTPTQPLRAGIHNVVVNFECTILDSAGNASRGKCSDTSGKEVQPYRWSFYVVGEAVAPPKVPPTRPVELPRGVTTGKYTIGNLNSFIEAKARKKREILIGKKPTDMKFQEGNDPYYTLEVTNRSLGRIIDISIERQIEDITSRPNDKGTLKYRDKDGLLILGDFYGYPVEFSDLTIIGVPVRGIKYNTTRNNIGLTLFTGRTEEPPTIGTFWQKTTMAMLTLKPTKKDELRLSALLAKEKGDYKSATSYPVQDKIYALRSIHNFNKFFSLDSQVAYDNHDAGSTMPSAVKLAESSNDDAIKISANYRTAKLGANVTYKRVEPKFKPVSVGSFIDKDKEGFNYSLSLVPTKISAINVIFDDYTTNIHDTTNNPCSGEICHNDTQNLASSLMLRPENLPALVYRYTKFTQKSDKFISDINGPQGAVNTDSEMNSLNLSYTLPALRSFVGTTLSAAFNDYDMDRITTQVSSFVMGIDTDVYSISTRYKGLFSLSLSNTEGDKIIYSEVTNQFSPAFGVESTTRSETKTETFGLQVNVIPFKFIVGYNYRRYTEHAKVLTCYPAGSQTPGPQACPYDNTMTTNGEAEAAHPYDKTNTINMFYYIDQTKILNLEFTDYDKEYRTVVNRQKSFNERVIKLNYTEEF